jgi:hypothetical protein
MGHAWFGAQLIWAMNVTLLHHGNIGIDFHLGRAWNEFDCLALEPACKAGVCGAQDLPTRPWHSPVARWPAHKPPANASLPPLATFPRQTSQMASSCEDRYFYCRKGSRRCAESERALPLMEQPARKALFLGCAESVCAGNLPSPLHASPAAAAQSTSQAERDLPPANSTLCAQRLLQLWLRVSCPHPEHATQHLHIHRVSARDTTITPGSKPHKRPARPLHRSMMQPSARQRQVQWYPTTLETPEASLAWQAALMRQLDT